MDRHITAAVEAAPQATIDALADLGTYPNWLSLVTQVEPVEDAEAPTWNVTLRARLGPLARSKRLRMQRTALDEAKVRFERREVDGREHADWVLEAFVAPSNSIEGGSDVVVHLHYSGALWETPLEVVLATFEGSAGDRLSAYLADA